MSSRWLSYGSLLMKFVVSRTSYDRMFELVTVVILVCIVGMDVIVFTGKWLL